MGFEVKGPTVVAEWDSIPAGATSAYISNSFRLPTAGIPAITIYHSGFGAAGAARIDRSLDGINWHTAIGSPALTEATPATVVTAAGSVGSFGWWRVRITHGGANGGSARVLITGTIAEE